MSTLAENRINFMLLAALMLCALSVVATQHKVRKYYTQLQQEQDAERRLDQEWRELQIESQTQSTGKRIEQKAVTQLGMVLPDPKKTLIVVLGQEAVEQATTPAARGEQ